jgi:hypothetical protein
MTAETQVDDQSNYRDIIANHLNPRKLASILATYNATEPLAVGEDGTIPRPINFTLGVYDDNESAVEIATVTGQIDQESIIDRGEQETTMVITISSHDTTTHPIGLKVSGITYLSAYTPDELASNFTITANYPNEVNSKVADYLYIRAVDAIREWVNIGGYIDSDKNFIG